MSDKKGISYYKDWIYIILFAIMALGYGAKFVLMSDQVRRNTADIKEADLKVMIYKLDQISEKVDKLTDLILEQ